MAKGTLATCAIGLALLGGCSRTTPSTPEGRTIAWRLEIGTPSQATFGARLFLDGEQVYLEANPTAASHRVDVVRPYAPGEHVIEVEIVSSSPSPAVYVASCTAQVNPTGKLVHADGVPWTLGVGERLRLSISL
jgi:hypothetical protein